MQMQTPETIVCAAPQIDLNVGVFLDLESTLESCNINFLQFFLLIVSLLLT